jgi:hypothetical protein
VSEQWTWPAGVSIVLFHWSWSAGEDEDGAPRLIHGWSKAAETDSAGYVHLEAETDSEAITLPVEADGYPSTRRHTFARLAELPLELLDGDGVPLPWVRELVAERAQHRA